VFFGHVAKTIRPVYTFFAYFKEDTTVKLGVFIAILAGLVMVGGACLPQVGQPQGDQALVISSLEATHTVVYPRGYTELKCVASDSEDDKLQFKWTCTGGELSGEGASVTWAAPDNYGDYHIMVAVSDGKGNSTQGIATVSVVVRPPEACCHGKRH
jgi:hypothetical protein